MLFSFLSILIVNYGAFPIHIYSRFTLIFLHNFSIYAAHITTLCGINSRIMLVCTFIVCYLYRRSFFHAQISVSKQQYCMYTSRHGFLQKSKK